MFVNSIDPVIAKLGIFEIRYYGIIYALGFIICYLFFRHFINKNRLNNVSLKDLDDLIFYILIGVVIGARLGHFLFFNTPILWTNPIEILKIWNGGLSFHGGLIGTVIALLLFSKKHNLKILNLADAVVVPGSLALAFGRIANFTNHELYGIVTDAPWCVQFIGALGCRHPYQLYASLSHFIMFGIVLLIYNKKLQEGLTFWSTLIIYGIFRILTDFVREESKYFGIGMGQFLSAIMVIVSIIFIIKLVRKNKKQVPG